MFAADNRQAAALTDLLPEVGLSPRRPSDHASRVLGDGNQPFHNLKGKS